MAHYLDVMVWGSVDDRYTATAWAPTSPTGWYVDVSSASRSDTTETVTSPCMS